MLKGVQIWAWRVANFPLIINLQANSDSFIIDFMDFQLLQPEVIVSLLIIELIVFSPSWLVCFHEENEFIG